MATRLSLYALNLPRFEEFLDLTVGEALWFYADQPPVHEFPVLSAEQADTRIRYFARPGEGVRYSNGDKIVPLAPQVTEHIPLLETSLADYLLEGSSLHLKGLLMCLCAADPDCGRIICEAENPWWIGTLLAYVESLVGAEDETMIALELLAQRLLRGANSGKATTATVPTLLDLDLPVLPADEHDLPVGWWTAQEADYFRQVVEWVGSQGMPTFAAPSPARQRQMEIPGKTDEEWTAWVIGQIEGLYGITQLGWKRYGVISFIST